MFVLSWFAPLSQHLEIVHFCRVITYINSYLQNTKCALCNYRFMLLVNCQDTGRLTFSCYLMKMALKCELSDIHKSKTDNRNMNYFRLSCSDQPTFSSFILNSSVTLGY